MYSLDKFRTHRLRRPPQPHIDLTIQSGTAITSSPAGRQRLSQELSIISPVGSFRQQGDVRVLSNQRAYKAGRPYNTVQVSEADRMFKLKLVETCAEQVLKAELGEVTYHPNTCRDLSQSVAALIMERIKSFALTQYKLVCIVSIGSVKDRPAMQFGSRCLWNKDTDNFVSVKYTNATIFAVAMIYGLYFD